MDAWVEHAHLLNPASQYGSGRAANSVLSEARETIADLLGAEPIEVIFTGSGTEADNLAIQGLFHASPSTRVVSTGIEHPAVREVVGKLPGAEVDLLPVNASGHVEPADILDQPAALATCMWANNETGAIQPVEAIAERAAAAGTPVHVDAVQVVGHLPVDFHAHSFSTLAASAHKFGGPRGVGLLLARRSPKLEPAVHGGGQERGLRPGTVDVASAIATAAALKEAVGEMASEHARLSALRDRLVGGVTSAINSARVTTVEPALPGHAHFTFPGANGDAMIMLLDGQGIEASTGSACNSGVNQPSHVLEAMGVDSSGALRFTLGRTTTHEDVDALLAALPEVIERATF
nr:cysteine sulfinate desulfinase/cysteine desulfurase [Streptococcus thermophilus]